jgi:rare lipoprotein A
VILVAACGCAATGPLAPSPAAPAPSPAPPDGLAGLASWYGPRHHGRPTASGAPYDMYAMTAAHRTLPLGARVRVTNLDNGRAVVVRITDRGPYTRDRVIDVSYAAAEALGLLERGVAPVRLEVLFPPE